MNVIGLQTLYEAGQRHADAEKAIAAFLVELEHADWTHPGQLRDRFKTASLLSNNRVIFNLKGNSYRILAQVNFAARTVFIRRFGTHAEYDKWDL